MLNPLSGLPAELKETVKIIRDDASSNTRETIDVAADVECHIVPNEDIIDTSGRVPTRHLTFKAHLAKYNADIHEGDIVVRNPDTDDEEEMHVYRVRPYGNVLMQLILRTEGVL